MIFNIKYKFKYYYKLNTYYKNSSLLYLPFLKKYLAYILNQANYYIF